MRVLVCGSRTFTDKEKLFEVLDEIHGEDKHITDIVHGKARGADTLGGEWGQSRRTKEDRYIRVWEFPAHWNLHGKAAGPIRNKQMLESGKPDLVIAFLAPNSKGTKNMIEQAEKAGVPVKIIEVNK